ncbi:MAG: hypothetical protein IJV83_03870 [Clostridia bacterium]|nr:hypothetical protein [Clostridia bacterium]
MKTRRFLSGLLAVFLLFGVACGEKEEKTDSQSTSSEESFSGEQSDVGSSETDVSEEEKDGVFTVKLIYNGEPFLETSGIEVQWSDGTKRARAVFEEDGKARMTGLDGDYAVTLYNLPEGYVYDPNVHMATNDDEDISIEIFDLLRSGDGDGVDEYNCIPLNKIGAYAVEIDSKTKKIFYQFRPRTSGTYTIQTIVDVTENVINPKFAVYNGASPGAMYFSHYLEDGGATGLYTRNPKYSVNVSSDNIGDNGQGVVYTFSVSAEHKYNEYPVTVYLLLTRTDYTPTRTEKKIVGIEDGYQQKLANIGYITNEAYGLTGKTCIDQLEEPLAGSTDSYQYIGELYELCEEDGFYHIKESPDAEVSVNDPILFARISVAHRFFQAAVPPSFVDVEAVSGTAELLVSSGTEWYKLFIEGYASCERQGVVGIKGVPECVGKKGLYDYISNSYGVYPVTEEVQMFLQKFAEKSAYFRDGEGYAETWTDPSTGQAHRIYADEDEQWLFACCRFI